MCGRVSNAILFAFLRNQTLLVTKGEQLTRYKSGLNMKKWFAPVTFVQKKDTKEKHATASGYRLVCKPGSAKILPAKR